MTAQKYIINLVNALAYVVAVYMFVSYAQASELHVEGTGETLETAVSDALRYAIEAKSGTLLFSKTESVDDRITYDKTLSISAGYIDSYTIISQQETEFGFIVKLKVNVDDWGSYDLPVSNESQDWQDFIDITINQRTLKGYANVLDDFLADANSILENGYSITIRDIVIEDIGPDAIVGHYLIRVIPNESYWDTYTKIIERMSIPKSDKSKAEGLFASGRAEDLLRCNACVTYSPKAPYIPKVFKDHIAKLIQLDLHPNGGHKRIYLLKNAVLVFDDNELVGNLNESHVSNKDVLKYKVSTLDIVPASKSHQLEKLGIKTLVKGSYSHADHSFRVGSYITDHHNIGIIVPFTVAEMSQLSFGSVLKVTARFFSPLAK